MLGLGVWLGGAADVHLLGVRQAHVQWPMCACTVSAKRSACGVHGLYLLSFGGAAAMRLVGKKPWM